MNMHFHRSFFAEHIRGYIMTIQEQLALAAHTAQHASISEAEDAPRINALLCACAAALRQQSDAILAANAKDLARMDKADPRYDRLQLTPARIDGIAGDMEAVSKLPSPLGKVLLETVRPNGMSLRKISVPFGVVGCVYEARPNVTCDVFSLCIKSGNVCVLKGGSDAQESNTALVTVLRSVLNAHDFPEALCTLLPAGHDSTAALLQANEFVDVIVPRGSSRLIQFVRQNASVPVIETGAGICHTYFDAAGDVAKGAPIITNAKTRRVSVCNALDCLIIHESRLADLSALCRELAAHKVTIYADAPAFAVLKASNAYPKELLCPATEAHFGTEFLDYKMSIKTVASFDDALAHIARYGSRHSESIISEDTAAIRRFQQRVDAACVYANVSTAFTDGGQFGFGAELGISTQKLHARGPMALPELTSYKYLIEGNGQIRQNS